MATHAQCGKWAEVDGRLLVCHRTRDHSEARKCYDAGKEVEFTPEPRGRRG